MLGLVVLAVQGPHVDLLHDLGGKDHLVCVHTHHKGVAVAEVALCLVVEINQVPADRPVHRAAGRVVDAMYIPPGPMLDIDIVVLDTIADSKGGARIRHLRVDFSSFRIWLAYL